MLCDYVIYRKGETLGLIRDNGLYAKATKHWGNNVLHNDSGRD